MLGNQDAVANIAVRNLEIATDFYEHRLGLTPMHTVGGEIIAFKSGNSTIAVYRSEFAGTNKATAMTWRVGDVSDAVEELKAKGITFDHYDIPGLELEGDVYVGSNMRMAWFKDPDGNILNIVGR